MAKITSSIPKTNIYRQINQYRWDIRIKVSDQMTEDLYIAGYEMILDVEEATLRSVGDDIITEIVELL